MRKALVTGMTAAAAVTAGCGQARSDPGPATSRSYQVGAFDRIEVAGPYEVQVTTGSAPSVHATGGERAIERMVVEVKGDTLEIHPQKRKGWNFGWSRKAGAVKLTVTVPSLRAAEIAGSGDISVDKVTGARFEGEVAGSGDLRLAQVAVDQLKMGIAGSGRIEAAGNAKAAEYEIAGSGDIRAGKVIAETAQVSIAGSGNVAGHATRTASVDIAGSGDVRLTGGARCKVSKAGSGNVDCS